MVKLGLILVNHGYFLSELYLSTSESFFRNIEMVYLMWVYCGKGSGCGKSMILVSVAMLPAGQVM